MDSLKNMPDEYWRKKLTPDQYALTRESRTEIPFSGKYLNHDQDGVYRCVACGSELFASNTKFNSHSGWPSFTNPINRKNIELKEDSSHGMLRTAVVCANCGAHLGHVFPEEPRPDGAYYCINSGALDFEAQK